MTWRHVDRSMAPISGVRIVDSSIPLDGLVQGTLAVSGETQQTASIRMGPAGGWCDQPWDTGCDNSRTHIDESSELGNSHPQSVAMVMLNGPFGALFPLDDGDQRVAVKTTRRRPVSRA